MLQMENIPNWNDKLSLHSLKRLSANKYKYMVMQTTRAYVKFTERQLKSPKLGGKDGSEIQDFTSAA
jgi:hypothetical protein